MVRLARRKAERRFAVFGCIRLACLAVESPPFQERIVFFLFQSIGRARALLIPRTHIARDRLAQRLGLGAFESNDLLRHRYSFSATGAGSSSSVSGASSSVKPNSDVTDCRTRDCLLCFSN